VGLLVSVSSLPVRQVLKTDIGNPAWLAVERGGGDKAAAGHPDQPEPLLFHNRDATAEAECRFTEPPHSWSRGDVLLVVKLQVKFCILLEFVTGDCAANPRARGIFTGDPVARFAAETDPADFSAYFQREKELRGGLRNAARYRAGRII